MVPQCMVLFCKNWGTISGVSYFRLTPDRHDDWMRAIGRDPAREHLTTGNSICSNHFLPEDLLNTPTGLTVKEGVMPKINLGTHFLQRPQLSEILNPNPNDPNHQHKKKVFGIIKNTIVEDAKKMKAVKREKKSILKQMNKANKLLEALGNKCDISKISKQLVDGPSNIIPNVNESGTENDTKVTQDLMEDQSENIQSEIVQDDMSATEKDNQELITIVHDEKVAAREEENNPIDCLKVESQGQATFLAGSDTAKEGLLRRKLKQLAENDIIKSKKIRELNNIIVIKNKIIEELREEIAKQKDKRERIQVPTQNLSDKHSIISDFATS